MKIIGSIAVAAAIAASSATAANAGGWGPPGGGPYGYGPYHHRHDHGPAVVYRNGPDAGGALLAGAFLGLAFGAIASQSYAEPAPAPEPVYLPPPRPNYAAVDQHVAWCTQTYRSYNAERDTFFDFQGIERRCVDPYQ
jgi:hypothetical protein